MKDISAVCITKIKSVNEVVGECTKRAIVVMMMKCKIMTMAKVVVGGQDDKQYVVTIFL